MFSPQRFKDEKFGFFEELGGLVALNREEEEDAALFLDNRGRDEMNVERGEKNILF